MAGRTETTYQLAFDDSGLRAWWLTVENTTGEASIRWADVRAVKVFKRDWFSIDCICMAFQTADGRWLEIREDFNGWSDLLPELPRFLNGCAPHTEWVEKVSLPPFKPNETEIFHRNA